jgi:phosphoglycolate phosphatase-like HAD superfamily hydrolase
MHLVWDWNGTLFDDLELVVRSVNAGLATLGDLTIDADTYRTHYTRPVKLFYERLFERDLTDTEWETLDSEFHRAYVEALDSARLTGDARLALDKVAAEGHTQSLLSMFPHEFLLPLVEKLGIAHYFDRIDGLSGEGASPGDLKASYLARHLDVLTWSDPPGTVAVIGDTPDDAVAARTVGARVVLFEGGSHHRADLDQAGVPVVGSLLEAVDLVLNEWSTLES